MNVISERLGLRYDPMGHFTITIGSANVYQFFQFSRCSERKFLPSVTATKRAARSEHYRKQSQTDSIKHRRCHARLLIDGFTGDCLREGNSLGLQWLECPEMKHYCVCILRRESFQESRDCLNRC